MRFRIQTRKRITVDALFMCITAICVYAYALLEHASISVPLISHIKMPIMYLGGICILFRIFPLLRAIRRRRYFFIFTVLFTLCCALLLTVLFYRGTRIGASPMRSTMRLILYLLEMFFLMVWASETGRGRFMLDFLFYGVLLMTVASDFLMFSRLIVFRGGRFETYLVGSKFSVSYFHMNLLTLWFLRNRERVFSDRKAKRVIILGVPYVAFVSVYVDCMTGVLGSTVLLILFLLLNTQFQRKLMRFNSPVLLTLCLLASVVFPFVAEAIVSIPAVTYFLEEVMGRDSTITGRTNIFAMFGNKMENHWLWGYGYGNGNVVSESLFGYANAQNALLQWILQIGIPATCLLILLMIMIFHQLYQSRDQSQSMAFVALIYVYIIMGTIETTFNMSFLLWFAMIFMLVNEKKDLQLRKSGLRQVNTE